MMRLPFPTGVTEFSGIDTTHPDPEMTDIFREGDPQYGQSVGDLLFPAVDVGAPRIRIPIHDGGEQYIRHRTERGWRQPHTEIETEVSSREFGYARFGVKAGLDFDEARLSEAAFRVRERKARLLNVALRLDQEVIRSELVADANFPA